jgi:glyoxylase-like metal-dependent hydrolase (beta-lactamase superfamily II)
VVITHAHSDHTGFAERARSEANATVRIHEADAEVAKTGAVPKNEAGVGRYLLRVEGTGRPFTGRVGPQIAPDGLNRDSERALRSLDALAALPGGPGPARPRRAVG